MGGASTSQQLTSFRCIKVVTYMILSWPSVQFLPCFQSQSKSIPFLIESPCINIFSLAAERTFHTRYAVSALDTFAIITIQSGDCWVRFAPHKVSLHLVAVTFRLASKVQENTWDFTSDPMRYHAIRLRFPSPRPAAFQLFTPLGRTEWWGARLDVIGCMFRFENEGATWNLGEDKFGFPKSWHDFHLIPRMQQAI